MKNITKQLKKIKAGSLVRVRWPDASGDTTGDGSIQALLRDHESVVYDTYGLYIGVSKGDVILTNDKRVDKDEYRGTLNIPKKWVIDIEEIIYNAEPTFRQIT